MAPADGSGAPVVVDLESHSWQDARWVWQPIRH
jgi:hypothetical protein